MAKATKPHNRIEVLLGRHGEWKVRLSLADPDGTHGKRYAVVEHPQRCFQTKPGARYAANDWSKATGWEVVEV